MFAGDALIAQQLRATFLAAARVNGAIVPPPPQAAGAPPQQRERRAAARHLGRLVDAFA